MSKEIKINMKPSRRYYGLKEGIIPKDWPYDQVVYLIRRKGIFRLVEVQESFK